MLQEIEPNQTLRIVIKCYDESPAPYMAYFENPEFAGTVVSGASIGDVIHELGISIKTLENFRKNAKKK